MLLTKCTKDWEFLERIEIGDRFEKISRRDDSIYFSHLAILYFSAPLVSSRQAYLTKVALSRIKASARKVSPRHHFSIFFPQLSIIIDRSNLDLCEKKNAFFHLWKNHGSSSEARNSRAASSSTSPITRGMRVDCNSRPIIASRTVNEVSLQASTL